jgi:hypothetical protein
MIKELDIKIRTGKEFDCYDSLIKSICEWRNLDYRMMFVESWGFEYEDNNPKLTITERLSEGEGDTASYLKDFHGVVLNTKKYDPSLIQEINTSIDNNRPVLLYVDSFWCKWDFNRYQKTHVDHFLCITGYDNSTQSYLCKDFQMAVSGKVLAADDFTDYCKEIFFIDFTEPRTDLDVEEILHRFLKRIVDNNGDIRIGTNIRRFANDLRTIDFNRESMSNKDAGQPVLFARLSHIGQNRAKFLSTLEYIETRCKQYDFDEEKAEIAELSSQWIATLAMLIKAFYTNDKTKILPRICDKFLMIADLEEKVIARMKNIKPTPSRQKAKADQMQSYHLDTSINKCLQVDLSPYMNNNAIFNKITQDCASELSNPHRYFHVESEVKSVMHELIELEIRNTDQDTADNVACEGQSIDVNVDRPKCLALIACSEFGSFKEKIYLVYDSNEIELETGFSSWLAQSPEYGEKIAVSGKGIVKSNNKIECYPFPAHLFSRVIRLDEGNGLLKRIILPDCINIHIFAISVCS